MINYEFKNKIISNVVDEEKFKEIQSDTLAFLATKFLIPFSLILSFL